MTTEKHSSCDHKWGEWAIVWRIDGEWVVDDFNGMYIETKHPIIVSARLCEKCGHVESKRHQVAEEAEVDSL